MAVDIMRHPHQDSVNEFLKVPKDFRKHQAKVNPFGFSPFDTEQVEQSAKLCGEFMKIANDHSKEPIKKVLEFAKEEAKTKDPELVRWALMNFIIHHSAARQGNLQIPPLIRRSTHSALPKKKKFPHAPGPAIIDRSVKKPDDDAGDIESLLDWYREDPNYNEHHEHWHLVYSSAGVPSEENPEKRIILDRHGELFIYMHRQMLARYDAERQAMNLGLVQPLDDYRGSISQAYKPDDELRDNEKTFGSRGVDQKLSDVIRKDQNKSIYIDKMEEYRRNFEDAIDKGQFFDGSKIDINTLGAAIEPSKLNKNNWDDYSKYYGGMHSKGHTALSYISDPTHADDPNNHPGVMGDTRVAARDPVFWRWHRHVDNLINKWEEKQGPNNFSKLPVKIRDGDIILAFKDKLPPNSNLDDFGEKTFGGGNFDTDVSGNKFVTDTLETTMKTRIFNLSEDSNAAEKIEYLYPREFCYFFRTENNSSSSFDATFRVFIVPEELADSRRHWIELDKFKQTLPPRSKTVVNRECDVASILRLPAQKTPEHMDDTAIAHDQQGSVEQKRNFCDCGLPYHLLLPRGRRGGMKFKLLVFISDWSEDEVPRVSSCGSISYCGGASPYEKYPDKKPMGYPLDRSFKNNSYKETFDGLDNATIRDVTINWVDDGFQT